ncbi:SNF2 family N-terminal domain-domain-containing protein [Clohesyomyces aquaticus]|uniref:SNF2 family N-terminal domain-domain-containing protein n=1 Tax=Clohesyomyces aquaticus TaxID=1231657 RepID=A0A1Y2A1A3_9PLEO|nr:SNF2 family N-terminal domain-domain-containing protein [Clohesyomyces aquaticus]
MTTVSATAQLKKAFLKAPYGITESQEPFEAILNFVNNRSLASSASEERSPKRRKLEKGNDIASQLDDLCIEDKSVLLAEITLGLELSQLAPEQREQLSQLPDDRTPLSISLESLSREPSQKLRLSLWSLHSPSHGLDLVADYAADAVDSVDALDNLASHLETAIKLSTTMNGKKRSKKPGASFARSFFRPPTQDSETLTIEVEIRWVSGYSVVENVGAKTPTGKNDMEVLTKYSPSGSGEAYTPWSLSDFYESVHVPPPDMEVSRMIQQSLPETNLYPFQQRAVDWLLRREGVAFSEGGELNAISSAATSTPVSFKLIHDAKGNPCYASHLRGIIVTNPDSIRDSSHALRGGILAEEMGLGKTVELIALVRHHKRQTLEEKVFDVYTGAHVKPTSATLIITPPSILEQWKTEINKHAPELKVLHYHGLPSQTASRMAHDAATVENLLRYDIVLTTYHVLSREVHYAKPPPDREFRHGKQHEPRRSPLVQLSWWRVCLDEAQMVENGVSQAATVARTIPRCNAWAVSGTPLRKDIQDLRGLLTFLRYQPFADCKAVWDRLDKPLFRTIFSQIAMRHTKDKIRQELQLPPQKRVVITVPFTAIEEQNYSELMAQMCRDCGLSREGEPLDDDQDVGKSDRMREWLVRLRQTCLHAHVGRKNRRALGAKHGPLRTVDEVLEVMIDQNDTVLKAEARDFILSMLRIGHILGNNKQSEYRSRDALDSYEAALPFIQDWVRVCRDELAMEMEKTGALSLKGVAPDPIENEGDTDDEEKGFETSGRVSTIRRSLRSFLELEQACAFFIGTSYFQIKSNTNITKPDTEEFHSKEKLEVEWYDKAKAIRTELLRQPQHRAQREMKRIRSRQPFHRLPQIGDLTDLGGIENRHVLRMMDDVTDILNAQAKQLEEWRQKVIDILLISLVDEDEGKETTGDEYEDSTKLQDELYVYVMALRTVVADRNAIVNGLQDKLIEHEMNEAERLARKGEGHAPELLLEVVNARQKFKPTEQHGSLKGVVSGTRSLLTSLQWRADSGDARAKVEASIAQKYLSQVQRIATEEAKALAILEKEQDLFRAAMNHRLEYYRQLQHISDTVAPWRENLDETLDEPSLLREIGVKQQRQQRMGSLKTKQTYLTNLRRENQHHQRPSHECIICQDEFEIGVLTVCGHKYCKECINHWWQQNRNCPMCKKKLYSSDFHDITFKPSEMKAHEENEQGSSSQPSTPAAPSSTSIYSGISDSIMREIKSIELSGASYGTKIDMIARHLLWIRHNDPGAKSIVFSQFRDFLEVLRQALNQWNIGSSSISDKNGISSFKNDPAIDCFLLDAKSDSSGLNLVNATNVFLCEPLINPAIELQAIARVHRIGQQRATTVFMYLISDTVEEAIYDISVSRRLEHIGKGKNAVGSRSGTTTPILQENALDAANSMEIEAAPLQKLLRKKGDGEIVQVDDLWACLFGKPRKQHNAVLEQEVGRHLRAEAAESRITQAASSKPGPS